MDWIMNTLAAVGAVVLLAALSVAAVLLAIYARYALSATWATIRVLRWDGSFTWREWLLVPGAFLKTMWWMACGYDGFGPGVTEHWTLGEFRRATYTSPERFFSRGTLRFIDKRRVWLDDIRPAPNGWQHVYSAAGAIRLLEAGFVTEMSLDHDLGDEARVGTGYQVACAIEEGAHEGWLKRLVVHVHSANPVGAQRMRAALEQAEKYWAHHEELAADLRRWQAKQTDVGSYDQ